jgi:hypothetical protein
MQKGKKISERRGTSKKESAGGEKMTGLRARKREVWQRKIHSIRK